jgi:hypothetical protein
LLTTDSDPDLHENIKAKDDIPDGKELKPWVRLSNMFGDGVEDEHLHTIVQLPAGMCNLISTVVRC